MLSRFHTVPERNGRTDRQTDGWTDIQIFAFYKNTFVLRETADIGKSLNLFPVFECCFARFVLLIVNLALISVM